MIKLSQQKDLKTDPWVTLRFDNKYGVYNADGFTFAFNTSEWEERFKLYDTNGDGYIDYLEAHRCIPGLKDMHEELTLNQVTTQFSGMKTTLSGYVLSQRREKDTGLYNTL